MTFGIVSDVDDTVMVTTLPRPLLAAWNTFVVDEHARRPGGRHGVLYTLLRQEHPGAPVIYLSTGAWNVVPTLSRFLGRNVYPSGALLLTDWGPTPRPVVPQRSGAQGEQPGAAGARVPGISWLLIGDDGQHDERIYRDFAAAHPENVTAIAIRRLTPGEAVLAGGRTGGVDHRPDDVPWLYADDGAGLIEQLRSLGLLAVDDA